MSLENKFHHCQFFLELLAIFRNFYCLNHTKSVPFCPCYSKEIIYALEFFPWKRSFIFASLNFPFRRYIKRTYKPVRLLESVESVEGVEGVEGMESILNLLFLLLLFYFCVIVLLFHHTTSCSASFSAKISEIQHLKM